MKNFFAWVLTAGGLLALTLGPARAQRRPTAVPFFADEATAPAAARAAAPGPLAAALTSYRALAVDVPTLRRALATAPPEGRAAAPLVLALPLPDGGSARYALRQTDVLNPADASRFPDINTYAGVGLDDPTATVRLDLTPHGFHAQVLAADGHTFYLDPARPGDPAHALSYWRRAMNPAAAGTWQCGFDPSAADLAAAQARARRGGGQRSSGGTLRTFRLAVAATGEYSAFHGGTVALAQAAIVTAVNRVNGVYEREVAVRMVLVANNSLLVYTNADPYTNSSGSTMLGENQTNVDQVIGNANYDIGHVFSTGGGGIAGLGVVCRSGSKAQGVTGLSSPINDSFYIDYVAHEMGHQFGGEHTFNNGTQGACSGGTREPTQAYEPGSGSTIMAYAGICSDNVQSQSDPYFHTASYDQVRALVESISCGTSASTGLSAPVLTLPAGGLTLPKGTPFRLTASVTNPNGRTLTYCWEQYDLGSAATRTTAQVANDAVPLFRSALPSASPTRFFPNLTDLRANANSNTAGNERLPTVARALTFRCTVRDSYETANGPIGAVTNTGTVALTVNGTAGPFLVTAPNTALTWAGGSSQTVTWDVAGTTANGVNCATVNVRLSTDDGLTYPTTLLSGTANDGSQAITVPNVATTQARILVEAVGNYFFDISNANFTIAATGACAAPTGVSVSGVGETTASVSWTASGSPTGYTVSTSPATTTQTVSGTTASLTGLAGGTNYTVQVVSNCAGGGTSLGATATFTTQGCTAPTGVTVSNISGSGATVNFTASAVATGYTITTTPATTTQNVSGTTAVLTGLSPSTSYAVNVLSTCAVGGPLAPATANFTTSVAGPANDDCANATGLTSGTSCVPTAGTLANATQSLAPITCQGSLSSQARDVWYSFVANNATHTITVTTAPGGTAFDGVLEVLSGPCTAPANVGCRDALSSGGETLTLNGLTAGTTYLVRYYEYTTSGTAAAAANSLITICITNPALPCAAPTSVAVGNIAQTTAAVNWLTSASALTYTVTTTPASTTQTVSGTSASLTGLVAGTAYTVRVVSNCAAGASSGAATASFTTLAPAGPANDACANAVSLTSFATCVRTAGTVSGASQSRAPINCNSSTSADARDVWFSFVANNPNHTIVVATATGTTAFDGVLEVMTGPCTALTNVGCRDSNSGGGETLTLMGLTSGTTYFIRYYPFTTAVSGAAPANGGFTICVANPVLPCDAATGVAANAIGTTTATVSYTASATATSYTITTTPTTSSQTISGTTASLTGLTAGTAYTVNVVSSCAGGGTSAAATASFTTLAPAPTAITSVTAPANGTYLLGQTLTFAVNFDASVTLNTSGSTPSLPLTVGSTARQASYLNGSGTAVLLFRYTVPAGDLDLDGVALGAALQLNGGSVLDGNGTAASLALNGVASTAGVRVDGVVPTVVSIQRQTPAAALTNAASVVFRIIFSEAVSAVDAADFTLVATGTAAGTPATVAGVAGSGGTGFDVTVNGLSGDGTLRLDLNATGTGIADLPGNPLSGGFAGGQAYTLDRTGPQTTIDSQPAASTSATSATFTFSGTDANGVAGFEARLDGAAFASASSPTSYSGLALGGHSFAVRAIDNAGNTDATPATYAWTVTAVAATCDPATSLSVSTIAQTTATVSYAASATATSYTISTSPASTTQTVSGTSASLTGLTAGTAYTVRVVSNCAAGATSAAATAAFSTLPNAATCNAPSGLAAGSIGNTSASVTFAASSSATSYTVSTVPATASQTVTASPISLNGLLPNTSYTVNVVSNCAGGATSPAASLAFTTDLADLVVSTAQTVAGAYRNVTVTPTGSATLSGNLSASGACVVQPNGVLVSGGFAVTGPGSFVLSRRASLVVGSPQGISASGASGSIRNTGSRTFSPHAAYLYSGNNAAQATGSGLPAQVWVLQNYFSTGPLTLSGPVAVRQAVGCVFSGNLVLNGQALTLLSTPDTTALALNSGSGVVVGTATVQRAIRPGTAYTGPGYRHYSSPVTATTVADLAVAGQFAPLLNAAYNALPTPALPAGQFPNVFDYEQGRLVAGFAGFDVGWRSPAGPSAALEPTRGYTLNIAPAALVDLNGTLATGPRNTGPLGRAPLADGGWQLLGNPYPAPVNWATVAATPGALPTGLADAIYVFEPTSQYGGQYRAFVNGLGLNGFDGVLPAMQGFFIRTTQAVPGGFDFQNAYRSADYGNPAFLRPAPAPVAPVVPTATARPTLRLALSAPATPALAPDETVLYLTPAATATGTDARFDAPKLPNPGTALGLATQLPGPANEALAINGLPLANPPARVPLLLHVPAPGRYRLAATALTGFAPTQTVLLFDTERNTTTDLRQQPDYAFDLPQAGPSAGRFVLLLGPATAPLAAATAAGGLSFQVWPNPAPARAALHLVLPQALPAATATLRDALGRTVAQVAISGTSASLATAGLAAGTYLLTVQAAGVAPTTRRVVLE